MHDILKHSSSTSKGKSPEEYIATWELANKQTWTNNQTLKSFMKFTNSLDNDKIYC